MKTILIIDDDFVALTIAKRAFGKLDIEVELVLKNHPKDALESFNDHVFDGILSDFNMPFLNGEELTREIANLGFDNIPVAIMSTLLTHEKESIIKSNSQIKQIFEKPFMEEHAKEFINLIS